MNTPSTTRSTASSKRHPGAIVHREGRSALFWSAVVLAALWTLAGRRLPRPAALLFLATFGFFAQFFRDPGADTPIEEGLVVAPAHGRIVHIGLESESEILHDSRLRISIFLSVFNPHVTRSPLDGQVIYQRYHPGRYLVAFHPKSSTLNERSSVLIETPRGAQVLVRQIAGLLARRICSYTRPGSILQPGQEIGFIKFGSRVDLFLPADSTILVSRRQQVRGGETPIARLPDSSTRHATGSASVQ